MVGGGRHNGARISSTPRQTNTDFSTCASRDCGNNYVDRATLSIANPLIRQDLGLSIADMGLLLSAFLWAYAFFQLPGGVLVDRVGPRRLLTVGLAVWSVEQAAAGFVGTCGQFHIAR